MQISDAVILHHLSPFLIIQDIAIFALVCKKISNLMQAMMKNVKRVEISRDVNIDQFMQHLTQKCPNVTDLNIGHDDLLSGEVIHEINKLPLVSLKCIRRDKYADINSFSTTGAVQFNIPSLTKIYVNSMYSFNLKKCKNIETVRVKLLGSDHLESMSGVKKCKEVMVDFILNDDDGEFNYSTLNVPLSACNVPLTRQSVKQLERLQPTLKSLAISMISHHVRKDTIKELFQPMKLHRLSIPNIKNIDTLIQDMPIDTLELYRSDTNMHSPRLSKTTITNLYLVNIPVNFNNISKLANLTTMMIDECKMLSNNMDILPIKHLIVDESLPLEYIKNMTSLLSLSLRGIHDVHDLQYLPQSLTSLTITNVAVSYDNFPLLPKLTTLKIVDYYNDNDDSDDDNFTSNNITKKAICIESKISDEGLRCISLCPIRHLTISDSSLCDNNVHYLTRMPLNYLDIRGTKVTITGLRQLKHLPLRKLLAPKMQTHHLLQL